MGDASDKVIYFPNPSKGFVRRAARIARTLVTTPPRHSCYKILRRYYSRFRPREFPFPQWVHLEVTNACNLDCVMCPRQQMNRPVGFMDMELFHKLMTQMKPMRRYIEGVALMGLGEPFLHKRLLEMSAVARNAGFSHVYTSTNGLLVDEDLTERILKEGGLHRLIFSIDGATAKTYEAVRLKGDFALLMNNIEHFLERKKQLGLREPRVTLQMLIMDQTRDEVDAFLDTWVPRLGPTDDILIKTVDTFGGQVDDYRTTDDLRPSSRTPCRQLWKDLSVSWDGRVTVCCKDVLYKLAVGNAGTEALAELWNSRKWNGLRKSHLAGKWGMDPCDQCDEWYL